MRVGQCSFKQDFIKWICFFCMIKKECLEISFGSSSKTVFSFFAKVLQREIWWTASRIVNDDDVCFVKKDYYFCEMKTAKKSPRPTPFTRSTWCYFLPTFLATIEFSQNVSKNPNSTYTAARIRTLSFILNSMLWAALSNP